MSDGASRRSFLKSVTALGTAAVPTAYAAKSLTSAAAHSTRSPESSYVFLTSPEIAFLEAALARLIPADELGPGAREAGVAVFIDRQLASAWGAHARNYRQGPWAEGTARQGYQAPLTPQQIYRAGIAETDGHCRAHHGMGFAQLAFAAQDETLRALEQGAIPLPSLASTVFFELLWRNTREGFFADPIHGGNRDKVGWKLVGFPGVAATYLGLIERHHEPYRVEPVSIADVRAGGLSLDEHGHPRHARLKGPS